MNEAFCNNPWNLNTREAESLWMLTQFEREVVAERQGVHYSALTQRLQRAKAKLEAPTLIAAVVEFDRWWQGAKASAPESVVVHMELELLEPVAQL